MKKTDSKELAEKGQNSTDSSKNKKSKEKLTKVQRRREWISAGCVVAFFALFLGGAALIQAVLIPNGHYRKGLKYKAAESYTSAIEEFTEAGGFRDSSEQISQCKKLRDNQEYQNAIALYKDGFYDEAMAAFSKLSGVGSSNQYYKLCRYHRGLKCLEEGQYDQAQNDFDFVGEMLDAPELLAECVYQKALLSIEAKDYPNAAELLSGILEYKNASELYSHAMEVIYVKAIVDSEVGSVVLFGSYEQDGNLTNGAEPVEWIVLDKIDGKVLLMSKYVLDCVKMHTTKPYQQTVWADTALRGWCNGVFFNTVFSENEKRYILDSTLDATTNTSSKLFCGSTVDKVFILSLEEVKKYLPTEESRIAEPTAYAIANGLYQYYGTDSSFWWLRTRGASNYLYPYYSYVNESGFIDFQRGIVYDYQDAGVRACVWLSVNE